MFDCFPDDVNEQLSLKFKSPCKDMFEWLAQKHPNLLMRLLYSDELKSTDMTFAAEVAGNFIDSPEVLIPLAHLLTSENDLIHEGAIKGITRWATNHEEER